MAVKMKRLFALLLFAVVSLSFAAGSYPSKPLHLIVPFGAGGGADIFARTLAKAMEKQLGQTIVVDNKPGGSSGVGLAYVMSQPADGYTLMEDSRTLTVLFARGSTPYKPSDLTYIASVNGEPSGLMVKAGDSRFGSLAQFVAYARTHQGQVTVGGPGSADLHHLVANEFEAKAGIKLKWVPYSSGKEAALALLGGHVDAVMTTPSNARNLIQSGKIDLLGVSSKKPMSIYPNTPTFSQEGYNIDEILWRGLFMKGGVPQSRVDRLVKAVKNAMQDPQFEKYMKNYGQQSDFLPPDQLKALVLKEVPATRDFLKQLGALGQ